MLGRSYERPADHLPHIGRSGARTPSTKATANTPAPASPRTLRVVEVFGRALGGSSSRLRRDGGAGICASEGEDGPARRPFGRAGSGSIARSRVSVTHDRSSW